MSLLWTPTPDCTADDKCDCTGCQIDRVYDWIRDAELCREMDEEQEQDMTERDEA